MDDEAIRKAFEAFDKNQDGEITVKGIQKVYPTYYEIKITIYN